MTHKSFTYLTVKAGDASDMTITGTASTAGLDRDGDVVEPTGADYDLPLPLLLHHDHRRVIGRVYSANVTPKGIKIKGKLTEGVKEAEQAWRLIQDQALNALSIGFKPIKAKPNEAGGFNITAWEWLELSIVAVGANRQARIGKSLAEHDVQDGNELDDKISAMAEADWPTQYVKRLTEEGDMPENMTRAEVMALSNITTAHLLAQKIKQMEGKT